MDHSGDAPSSHTFELVTTDADDPRVVERQLGEEYTTPVVPPSARIERWKVLGRWSSIVSAMAFVYYGALAASMAGVGQAVVGLVVAVAIFGLLGGLSGSVAIRWGLNSTLLSREVFGHKAAAITPLLVGLGAVYYAVFESSVLAVALHSYFQFWDIRIWYAIVVVGMLPLMLGGMQTWLGKLNAISLPVYFFGLIAAVVVAGLRFGWTGDWSAFEAGAQGRGAIPGWLTVVVLYLGIFILFPETQDAARFGRRADSRFHAHITFGWVFYAVAYLFSGLAGILVVGLAAPKAGISEAGVVTGVTLSLGFVGLLVIVVSQVRINSANFYFASVNFERFVAHFSRRNLSRQVWVVVLAVVVLALMFTDVFSYIAPALAWQAVLMVSFMGIVAVHWVFDRGREPEFRPARLRSVAPGFAVWMVSAGVGILLLELPDRFPVLSALAPIASLVLAALLYGAVRVAGLTALRPGPRRDVREMVGDPWVERVRCGNCELSYVAFETDLGPSGRPLCLQCQSLEPNGLAR